MTAIPPVLILAGGLGTRIKSRHPNLPKSLVPIHGEPFVAHQMRLLARQGVKDVVLCVGHLSQPLVEFVGDGKQFGLGVCYSHDGKQLLGTGGAVRKASSLVGSPFSVIYGDSYLDVELMPIHEAFIQAKKQALMTVYRNNNRLIPSNLLVENGLVTAYNKLCPAPNMVHSDFGLTIFESTAFNDFDQTPLDLSDVLNRLIQRHELAACEVANRFYEIGTPQGIADLENYLLRPKPR